MRLRCPLRLADVDADVADAAQLLDRLVWVVERLPVPPLLVLDLLDALALDGARDDRRRLPVRLDRLRVGTVDLIEVVPVDLDRLPSEGASAVRIRIEIPAVH